MAQYRVDWTRMVPGGAHSRESSLVYGGLENVRDFLDKQEVWSRGLPIVVTEHTQSDGNGRVVPASEWDVIVDVVSPLEGNPMSADAYEQRIPATMESIMMLGRLSGYTVHGDTADGECDVEFSDAFSALHFRNTMSDWHVSLRAGDVIADLDEPVVMTVKLDR